MMGFFLFWIAVAAAFLNPVPALSGVVLGAIGGLGRVKAAFAVGGIAIVIVAMLTYLHDQNTEFADAVYWVAVQLCSMLAWTLFVGALTLTLREALPKKTRDYLLRIGAD